MWSPLRKGSSECDRFRESLEEIAGGEVLPTALQKHASECRDCQAAVDELLASRRLLSALPRRAEVGPWFAPRVMAAIAARESEVWASLETWAAVPRLAARLTWISGLALLLASTWLYESPRFTQNAGSQATVESLFDSPQSSPPQDDVVLPLETAQ